MANPTRLTIVDETGRVYERWDVDLRISIQDDGRTVKIFVNPQVGTDVLSRWETGDFIDKDMREAWKKAKETVHGKADSD